eukprot:9105367-Heterocapsa_arctica.AAC.2
MAVVVCEKGRAWMGPPPRRTMSCPLVILLRSSDEEGGPLTRVMGADVAPSEDPFHFRYDGADAESAADVNPGDNLGSYEPPVRLQDGQEASNHAWVDEVDHDAGKANVYRYAMERRVFAEPLHGGRNVASIYRDADGL